MNRKELEWAKASLLPGFHLVQIGSSWGAVGFESSSAPSSRWEGRLLKSASGPREVWWTAFCTGKTRKEVIEQLKKES